MLCAIYTSFYCLIRIIYIIIPIRNFVNTFLIYNSKKELKWQDYMKIRKKMYGNANMVGKNIERIRKEHRIKQKDFIAQMQIRGCDINPTSYSILEGQLRSVTDREIYTIAKVLNVTMEELFDTDITE